MSKFHIEFEGQPFCQRKGPNNIGIYDKADAAGIEIRCNQDSAKEAQDAIDFLERECPDLYPPGSGVVIECPCQSYAPPIKP